MLPVERDSGHQGLRLCTTARARWGAAAKDVQCPCAQRLLLVQTSHHKGSSSFHSKLSRELPAHPDCNTVSVQAGHNMFGSSFYGELSCASPACPDRFAVALQAGHYKCGAYCLAKWATMLPLQLVYLTLYTCVVYFLVRALAGAGTAGSVAEIVEVACME